MKKLKVLAIAASLFITSATVAQTKIAYINIDNVVALMPEVSKIDSLLQRYQVDSLNAQFALDYQEYTYKDSILTKTDTSKIPVSVRSQMREELAGIAYRINNWQAISQQLSQQKQEKLLAPVYSKVYDAVKAVAKEKNYTHVFNKEVFLVAPEADDLLPAVAARLKLKLPPQQPTGPVLGK
ncbi:MAG: OmpH family outer membrane protein [Bacteroidota bacterium]|nr:OmpH family outer membrane protein [Bacteroidota bacterium]